MLCKAFKYHLCLMLFCWSAIAPYTYAKESPPKYPSEVSKTHESLDALKELKQKFQTKGIKIIGGIARKDADGTPELLKETLSIPLIPKTVDPDYNFGIVAFINIEGDHKCKASVETPKQRKINVMPSKDFVTPITYEIDIHNLQKEEILLSETLCNSAIGYALLMQFDQTDSPGTYVVKVYIDGVLQQVFNFNVHLQKEE